MAATNYETITGLSSVQSLTPGVARTAWVQAHTQNVRMRLDGDDPTSSTGTTLIAGQPHTVLNGPEILKDVRLIEETASATVTVQYFG